MGIKTVNVNINFRKLLIERTMVLIMFPINNLRNFTYTPQDLNPVHTSKIEKFCLLGFLFSVIQPKYWKFRKFLHAIVWELKRYVCVCVTIIFRIFLTGFQCCQHVEKFCLELE
jgi:hypothetical protein